MEILEGPVVVLTGEDVWRLLTGRADRQLVAELQAVARQYEAELGWRASLRPVAEVAVELGITAHALRRRIKRGAWPGERMGAAIWALPPSAPGAPEWRPCPRAATPTPTRSPAPSAPGP